jgi:tRNA dimethylallyltransferase
MGNTLVVITGPTGIGKTKLSIDLARYFGCEIFSADSRQIFKRLDIGTAKPQREILQEIKHHFVDEIEVTSPYNVGIYVDDLRGRLEKYFKFNDIGILVGGTGLYIHSFLNGINEFPDIPTEIRDELNKAYINYGIEYLQEEAKMWDPKGYEKVDIDNPRRLMRIIEVSKFVGKPYSDITSNKSHANAPCPYNIIKIRLTLNRTDLYERINARVDQMLMDGLVDEVHSLLHYRDCQALQTVGYKEVFEYLDGKISEIQMKYDIMTNSRRYAKRQETWLKKYFEGHIMDVLNYNKTLLQVKEFLNVK